MLSKQDKEAQEQARLVVNLSRHKGWSEVLEQWLKVKLNQAFPDPSEFKDEKEFTYAAKTTAIFKKVIAEILQFVESQKEAFEVYKKREAGEEKDPFKVGG